MARAATMHSGTVCCPSRLHLACRQLMQTGMLMHTLRSFMVWSLQHCVLAHEVHQQRSYGKTQCSNDQTMKDLRVCISMPVHIMAGTTESEPTLCHLAALTPWASIDVFNAVTYRDWHAQVCKRAAARAMERADMTLVLPTLTGASSRQI